MTNNWMAVQKLSKAL